MRTLSSRFTSGSKDQVKEDLVLSSEHFDNIAPDLRNKQTFLSVVNSFCKKKGHARGHVEFINSALKYMKEYGLQKDLDIYKALLGVLPKGPMIPQNVFQKRILYYPQQQICCVNLLDEMEWFGECFFPRVQPDKEMHDLVVNIFGEWNYASKKMKRMMYWMPKLKYSNTYLDRRKVEEHNLGNIEFSYLALKMISRDPGTRITLVKTNDAELDESDRWLLSAQSPLQMKLLHNWNKSNTLYVDGPNKVYLMNHCLDYVGLFADSKSRYYEKYEEKYLDEDFENWKSEWDRGAKKCPKCSIHEQQHETVLGLSVFGKVCRETAASWINHLQKTNPSLCDACILFRTKEANGISVTQLS
ncbi:unnamed protein product [Thelazia callipaeda]|uniref:Evolutionarily conserved signaling intermediate in Toll pathway, mitochondrial n=1 Tax=Thelazia callipaeda TaxID=103827 RepID=A0A0N5CZ55_THECL|nr:unnamed protein product [Thelazia callipaeda]